MLELLISEQKAYAYKLIESEIRAQLDKYVEDCHHRFISLELGNR